MDGAVDEWNCWLDGDESIFLNTTAKVERCAYLYDVGVVEKRFHPVSIVAWM